MFTLTHRATPLAHVARKPRAGLMARVLLALRIWRSRRDLIGLTPEQLDDIGVTPRQAAAEAARPIWDVPEHWRD